MFEKTMVLLLTQDQALEKINKALALTPTAEPDMPGSIAQGVTNTGSSLDSFMQLVGLVFLLIIILIATYYTTKFVGKTKLGQLKNSNFKVIDAYRISPNKVIQIVKIGNKYVVLGIGKDTINLIAELDEAEVLIREIHAGEKMPFKQILEKMRNNK